MVGEEEKVMDGEVERESGEETEEKEKEDGDRREERVLMQSKRPMNEYNFAKQELRGPPLL